MGLITLFFLLALTAVYLSKTLEKKPEFVNQVVVKINDHMDKVALWGASWGGGAAILTLVMGYSGGGMMVRLLANVLIILMALPFVMEQQLPKFQEKMNPVILEEAKNFSGFVTKQEKYIGYAGAAISLLLFAVVFR